jgi:hypothetical protein
MREVAMATGTSYRPPGTLPSQASGFVGRETELSRVRDPSIAAGEGRYERTAWLFGAAAPLWERTGRWYTGSPGYEALHQVAERVARAGLGDDRFWRLRAAGAAAPLDEAVARALSDTGTFDEPA